MSSHEKSNRLIGFVPNLVAANELLVYDALGLAPPGKAHTIVEKKDNTYGGKWVINASGGLLAKGHPLGSFFFSSSLILRNKLTCSCYCSVARCDWSRNGSIPRQSASRMGRTDARPALRSWRAREAR